MSNLSRRQNCTELGRISRLLRLHLPSTPLLKINDIRAPESPLITILERSR
jgi:hypothetical protein